MNGQDEYRNLPPILKNRRVSESMSTSSVVVGDMADTRPSRNMVPTYVKHGFPELFREKKDYYNYLPILPQLPGSEGSAEEHYGLMYHKPGTEAECNMHDLWIAKRRQEAFNYKAQQQLSLVLDRMAMHRSQLESDLLRRHETAAYLRGANTRPKSPVQDTPPPAAALPSGKEAAIPSPIKSPNRFAPIVDPGATKRRVLSGRINKRIDAGKYDTHSDEEEDIMNIYDDNDDDEDDEDEVPPAEYQEENSLRAVTNVDAGNNKTLVQTMRKDVKKPQKGVVPFRFSTALPLTYKTEFYMELSSDSEDEEENRTRTASRVGGRRRASSQDQSATMGHSTTNMGSKTKPLPKGMGGKVLFKRDKPINREVAVSPALYRSLVDTDPELKVMYRHTNFRRMPLTARMEHWLEGREAERVRTSMELAKKMMDEEAAKSQQKKEKDGKEKGPEKDKDKAKKNEKRLKEEAAKAAKVKAPPAKYKSATQFMALNFPQFDDDSADDRVGSCGPMKILQMAEVERVLDVFAQANVAINEAAVRKALVIPQDHPDAICLEGFRSSSVEGLMANPLPPEYWKKSGVKKKKAGGGKRKKAKK
jgi:hypothetical protein